MDKMSYPAPTVHPVPETHLLVLLDGRAAGTMRVQEGTAMFRYDPDYRGTPGVTPLSLRLPLHVDGWQDAQDWLDGLMPPVNTAAEFDPGSGWRPLTWPDQAFRDTQPITHWLSKALGLDCAGSVQFLPDGSSGSLERRAPEWVPLSGLLDHDLFWYRARHDYTAMAGPAALHGAQFKLGATRHPDGGDRWALPTPGAPSTHILKPNSLQFNRLAVVEHLCLTAARNLRVSAAVTQVVEVPMFGPVLLVERFDRQPGPDGTVRVHQEDLQQTLGTRDCYQQFDGPTVQQVGVMLRHHTTSVDACGFFEQLVFRWLAGDNDGHGKNTSLQLVGDQVRLAPLYDVCSLLPYADGYHDSYSMAMWPAVADEEHLFLDAASPRYWEAVARELDVPSEWAVTRAREMAEGMGAAVTAARDSTPDGLLVGAAAGFAEHLAERSQHLAAQLLC